mgnify:CR=1 FL=1
MPLPDNIEIVELERFKYKLYKYNYMKPVTARVKRWGNSLGVILPKNIVDQQNISEGSEIELLVNKGKVSTVGDLFEFARSMKIAKSRKSTEEIMREIDKDFWPKNE